MEEKNVVYEEKVIGGGPVSYTHLDVYKRQGLAIVRDTALRYGGTVTAAPRQGGGTVFTGSFPLWRKGGAP